MSLARLLEVTAIVLSTVFAFTLGIMMIRLKISDRFHIKDHVESNVSFDLDLSVIVKMRHCYVETYKDKIIPGLNRTSFILMLICYGMFVIFTVARM